MSVWLVLEAEWPWRPVCSVFPVWLHAQLSQDWVQVHTWKSTVISSPDQNLGVASPSKRWNLIQKDSINPIRPSISFFSTAYYRLKIFSCACQGMSGSKHIKVQSSKVRSTQSKNSFIHQTVVEYILRTSVIAAYCEYSSEQDVREFLPSWSVQSNGGRQIINQ